MSERLSQFSFEGDSEAVHFVEAMQVNDSVVCDVYTYPGNNTKDLGIIKIKAGGASPLQRVLKGEETLEGHLSGSGKLVITKPNGDTVVYSVSDEDRGRLLVEVNVGDIMQWLAYSDLIAYEICKPPYKEGRYEDL